MTVPGMQANHHARQHGWTVWLTGLSGAGKSSVAQALAARLLAAGHAVAVLDGDVLRQRLNRDLGFSPADRRENLRRTAEVARLLNEAGLIALCALISPHRADRAMARAIIGAGQFIEIHISTPLTACAARDPKGLYRQARGGQIAQFTGVSAPYEAPPQPALALDMATLTLEQACQQLLDHLAPRLAAVKT